MSLFGARTYSLEVTLNWETYYERIKFKYVGPVPTVNFVELVVVLEGRESERTT